jgi:hypothetical protein
MYGLETIKRLNAEVKEPKAKHPCRAKYGKDNCHCVDCQAWQKDSKKCS